ncbi:MAG: ABC transporter permease [Thermomicrobia bacterium]|nr:ABC transporter permease [Thermomicrobia bacterium]MCA1724808.1 ABC transporter permease [Thermomicrobia bacterium]
MRAYIANRLLQTVVVIVGISMIAFTITYLVGDPLAVLLPLDAPKEQRDVFRHALGLDQSLPMQYYHFVARVATGNFGDSYVIHKPAYQLIVERMPATLLLTFSGLLVALMIAVPLGILAAYHKNSWIDNLSTVIAVAGSAMPIYWLGLMLIILFGVRLRWLPPSGYGSWRNLIMPAFTLGVFLAPITMRLVRSGMLDTLSQDYIRVARAKGLTERAVLARHALKNVMIPVISVLGLQFGQLLGGAIVTETTFAWPGVASQAVSSIQNQDRPVVQAAVMILATLICLVNLGVDILVAFLDPRTGK